MYSTRPTSETIKRKTRPARITNGRGCARSRALKPVIFCVGLIGDAYSTSFAFGERMGVGMGGVIGAAEGG